MCLHRVRSVETSLSSRYHFSHPHRSLCYAIFFKFSSLQCRKSRPFVELRGNILIKALLLLYFYAKCVNSICLWHIHSLTLLCETMNFPHRRDKTAAELIRLREKQREKTWHQHYFSIFFGVIFLFFRRRSLKFSHASSETSSLSDFSSFRFLKKFFDFLAVQSRSRCYVVPVNRSLRLDENVWIWEAIRVWHQIKQKILRFPQSMISAKSASSSS